MTNSENSLNQAEALLLNLMLNGDTDSIHRLAGQLNPIDRIRYGTYSFKPQSIIELSDSTGNAPRLSCLDNIRNHSVQLIKNMLDSFKVQRQETLNLPAYPMLDTETILNQFVEEITLKPSKLKARSISVS